MLYQIYVIDDIQLFKCILRLKQYCKDNSLDVEFVRTLKIPKSLIINCSESTRKNIKDDWIIKIEEYHPLYLQTVVDK